MEKSNKKQEITEAALKLFSVQGFEATSISQIADAVNIQKASLYSHFESKQAILDALVKDILEQYSAHSIFANADWDDPKFTQDEEIMTYEVAVKMVMKHVHYILNDPYIRMGRKMLVIEQFQNEELSALLTKQNYTDVMKYFIGLMNYLIRCGTLINDDSELMAAELCLPITVWISLCDREPEREPEVMDLIDRHIRHFFKIYGKLDITA